MMAHFDVDCGEFSKKRPLQQLFPIGTTDRFGGFFAREQGNMDRLGGGSVLAQHGAQDVDERQESLSHKNMENMVFYKSTVGGRRLGLYRNAFKRVFDIVFVLASAVICLPLILILCLIIYFNGGSPMYWSDRVGRGGRVFKMMKLRTMVADSDARLAAYLTANPEALHEWDTTQKLKDDPRITRIGSLLRKTSLDELPQLWNVLTGDMSLVGPRPMMPNQQDLYEGTAYYRLRPGVTGPWQVSDRNESEFAARVGFDQEYDRNLTFLGDLRLILRTISVVIKGTGY